jgi:hypothetical protein
MDPAMSQLLASRLGLASGYGDLQPNDIAAALANQGANPLMASLIAEMASRKQTREEEVDPDHKNYERELQRLKRIIARLRQEVASANVMAHFIADIFGTCHSCWGLNKLCQQCGGKGSPGYGEPDLEQLRDWVEPALRKGGLHIASSSQ